VILDASNYFLLYRKMKSQIIHRQRETRMLKHKQVAATVALTAGILLILPAVPDALAQTKKKMTYEQAFAQCKKEIAGNVPMTDATTTAARHSAGGACMKKYGFRLKKGSQF
jgi:hypothetical protein